MEKEIGQFRSSTRRWLFGSFAGWLTLLLCFVAIGFAIILARWWKNIGARYELTDQRLIIRTGIVMKRTDEIELYRVKDVRVDYSLLNQMVDIGTISLRSSDATTRDGVYAMTDIPHARDIREQIRTLVDQARQRRRVREFDVDYEH